MNTKGLIVAALVLAWSGNGALADPPGRPAEPIRRAIEKALPLLQKGATGHMTQRTCYACHNQGLPILAITTAKQRGFKITGDDLPEHLNYINEFLDRNRDNYKKGKGQGGQVATAGYALWTLELGGFEPNETTAAVTEYLLETQKERDHWRMTSNRPPSETSHFTTSYLAIRNLQAYGTAEQKDRIGRRLEQVRQWLIKTPARDTEDRVFRLLALERIGADGKEIKAACQELLETQHESGGWAQLDKMAPDAYATGSALVALHQAGGLKTTHPSYRAGIDFLLRSQHPDGSWHTASRSKPFQTYFESGFPHGKDQFISIAASGWATTALALTCPAK
jgi:hypothetical protein